MPSGWHNWLSVRLKRAKGLERSLWSLSLLSSSAHTFFFPEMWETSQDTEWAWDQEATRRRKRLSGQAVPLRWECCLSLRAWRKKGTCGQAGCVPSGARLVAPVSRSRLCTSARLCGATSHFLRTLWLPTSMTRAEAATCNPGMVLVTMALVLSRLKRKRCHMRAGML